MRTTHQNTLRTRALVAALTCAVGSAQAAQAQRAAMGFVPAAWQAVSDAQLDALRGGFEIKPNLSVSFGFMRSVTINGDLVSEISFHLPDLSSITADQARMVSDALAKANIIQNGIGNRVGASLAGSALPAVTAPAAPPASVAPAAPQSVAAGAASGAAPIAASVPVAASAPQLPAAQLAPALPTSVSLVPMAPMVPAAVTVVQNTLDNQAIKSMTVIDAGVNSLGLLRSINVQTVLKDALMGAIGVR